LSEVVEEIRRLYEEAEEYKVRQIPAAPLHSHFGGQAYAYRRVLHLMKEMNIGQAIRVGEGEV
jgi:hypothetical protein